MLFEKAQELPFEERPTSGIAFPRWTRLKDGRSARMKYSQFILTLNKG
jgi:hypothetical protein